MTGPGSTPLRLDTVVIGGDAAAWRSVGFTGDDRLELANGSISFDPTAISGIAGFRVHTSAATEPGVIAVDGVRFEFVDTIERMHPDHPNGAFELDHVVLTTDSLDRTCASIETELGLPLKRVREVGDVRQGFHRFADDAATRGCIIEVVESSLGAAAVGAVGYFSNLFMYDRNGLVTREVALREPHATLRSPGHDKLVPAEFFARYEPTYYDAGIWPVAEFPPPAKRGRLLLQLGDAERPGWILWAEPSH